MQLRNAVHVALTTVLLGLLTPITAAAKPTGSAGPNPSPPPQTGPITVEHRDGSGTSTTTSIPSGSAFRTQGGGDRAPCKFDYLPDNDNDGLIDADAVAVTIDSDRWKFRETTDNAASDEALDFIVSLSGKPMADAIEQYGTVDTAFRRFDVFCTGTHGSGLEVSQFRNSIQVSINDAFWGYRGQIDQLRTQIPWPTITSGSQPESTTFGGLPVNMPANFQINAAAWGSFLSPTQQFRGWTAQIVITAADADFAVTFKPDNGPVTTTTLPCLTAYGNNPATTGLIPPRGLDVPDFAEPGQYDAPCVWIPPRPGQVSVTARVTYQVRVVVSGPGGTFQENLGNETRTSPPLQLRVDNLSIVNTRPNKTGPTT